MRTAFAALALVVAASEAQAAGKASLSVSQILADPKSYRGKEIEVRGVRCVDPGAGGFTCKAAVGERRLRLDALILGASTDQAIAEKLIGTCKGEAALSLPTCTFNVTFSPTGSGLEDGVTVIYTRDIDMSAPRRR